jgi:hypothetical protein
MNTTKHFTYIGAMAGILLLAACLPDRDRNTSSDRNLRHNPVFMTRATLEKSIKFSEARPITNGGKIHTYMDYLFVVENFEGVHIIDNSNPENPYKTGFLICPGAIDVSVKDGVIYLDNAVDLVSLKLASLPTIEILDRVKDVFPEHLPPGAIEMPENARIENREGYILIKWTPRNN